MLLSTYVFIHCCILGRILLFFVCCFVFSRVVGVGRRTGVMGAQYPQHLKNTQFSVTVCSCGWNRVHGYHCLFFVFFSPFQSETCRWGILFCHVNILKFGSASNDSDNTPLLPSLPPPLPPPPNPTPCTYPTKQKSTPWNCKRNQEIHRIRNHKLIKNHKLIDNF